MKHSFIEIVFILALYHCVCWSQAQQLSSLTTTSSLQATGSTAVVTAVASSLKNVSALWGFLWSIQQEPVALIVVNANLTTTTSLIDNSYNYRITFRNFPDTSSKTIFTIKSQLILNELQKRENNLEVSIHLENVNSKHRALYLNITDCSSRRRKFVYVLSEKSSFNSLGHFSCSNNGTLFNVSGVPLRSNETVCMGSATWSGEEAVQCWKAPQVVVKGLKTVIEGNSLNFTCEYADVIPVGVSSRIYIDGVVQTIRKGQTYTLKSVNSSLDNKQVTCQAVTPYTQKFKDSGKSPPYTIDVQYVPYEDTPLTCTWKVNKSEWCNVTFKSNPRSTFVKLVKTGSIVRTNKLTSFALEEDPSETKDELNRSQKFFFKRLKASASDGGYYTLSLHSSIPPYNHSITFKVIIIQSVVDSISRTGLIAGVIAATIGFVVVLSGTAYFYVRKKRSGEAVSDTPSRSRYNELTNQDDVAFITMHGV